MRQWQTVLEVRTPGRGMKDITREVADWVTRSGAGTGLLTVFIRHTSASLIIQENADPDVRRDLEAFFCRLAPEDDTLYRHRDEGPDDMPSHLRSAVTRTGETIPISGGRLALGTWQAIYVWEHRTAPHTRRLVVTVMGSKA